MCVLHDNNPHSFNNQFLLSLLSPCNGTACLPKKHAEDCQMHSAWKLLMLKDFVFHSCLDFLTSATVHLLKHTLNILAAPSFEWMLNTEYVLVPCSFDESISLWQKDEWAVSFSFWWKQMESLSTSINIVSTAWTRTFIFTITQPWTHTVNI